MDLFLSHLPDIHTLGSTGYALVFVLVFLESLVFTGMIVPGAAFAVMLGALSAHGYYDLRILLVIGAASSVLGDALSYEIGKRNAHLTQRWPRLQRNLPRAEHFFARFGHFGVIFGRFFGWTRPLVPFAAGVVGYPRGAFYPICALSCALWSITYIGAGYAFGEAWRVSLKWSSWALAIVFVAAALTWGLFWLWRYWMVLGSARLKRVLEQEREAAKNLILDQKLPGSPTPMQAELERALETPTPPSWS